MMPMMMILAVVVVSNTEACNFDSDDVHDDGGGGGGGVRHRSLYCDVDADDVHDGGGGGVDQVFCGCYLPEAHYPHCEEEVDIVVECRLQYFDKSSSCRKCNLNEQCKPMKVQYKDFFFCVKDKDEDENEDKDKDKEKEKEH